MVKAFVVIGLLLLLAPATLDAADGSSRWYSRSYSSEDGLPSTIIHAISQDEKGYLWLGTGVGLVRFDGTEFVEWRVRAGRDLQVGDALAVLAARDGSVWVGFANHAGLTRVQNGRVTRYVDGGLADEGSVSELFEDSEGAIWSGGQGGLNRFAGTTWEHLGDAEGIPRRFRVLRIYEDREGNLWAGGTGGVFRRPKGERRFTLVDNAIVRDFAEDRSGELWVTDDTLGLRRLTGSKQTSKAAARGGAERMGSRLLSDQNGQMWVGTFAGLLRIPDASLRSTPVLREAEEHPPVDVPVLSLFADKEGGIWVGTRGGLFRFFEPSVRMLTQRDGLVSDTVGGLATGRDGSVWIGTADGVNRFVEGRAMERHDVPGLRPTTMHVDRTGRLWIGTDGGLGTFDRGQFVPVPVPAGAFLGRTTAVTSDKNNTIWVCSGLLFQWSNGRLREFDDPALGSRRCTTLRADSRGDVWIGLSDGTLAYYKDQRFELFSSPEMTAPTPIITLYSDDKDMLWIAGYEGLGRVDDGKFIGVSERNGFPGKRVTAMVDDRLGHLWLAVHTGIVRMRKDEFDKVKADPAYRVRYELYDSSDGLMDVPGASSTARGSDGQLWFQSVRGVAVINPAAIREDHPRALAQVERVIADGTTYGPTAHLNLPPRLKSLEIDYAAVNLSAASKTRFMYRLDGVDETWIDAGARRQAFYTRLAPGPYRFQVRASINGVPQSAAAWDFAIEPAFYQRGWFYALCAGLAALTLWGAWQWRVRTMRHQFDLVLGERARIAREIHDTVLQGMAGAAMQLEGAERKVDRAPAEAKGDLQRLRRQIRQHISDARESILALRGSGAADRPTLFHALREFGERLADGQRQIQVVVTGSPTASRPEIERELQRIGQEAMQNAVRHGDAKCVLVGLHYEEAGVRLQVEDDGCGFDPEEQAFVEQPHWGLIGMRERAQKIGAQINIVSQPGRGTHVEVICDLPHGMSALHAEA